MGPGNLYHGSASSMTTSTTTTTTTTTTRMRSKSPWVMAPLSLFQAWGSARHLYLYLSLLESSRVVSCLGKLVYEIGVCIEVYPSFYGEFCIHGCGVFYIGILMRSLLVPSLHSVYSSRNQPYMMILMGRIDLISGMALKTLFNIEKHTFGLDNMHVFSSSDIAKTFMLLCLKCYVDKEDNLMCYDHLNVYALYALHLSHHQLSVLSKPLLAKLFAK